MIYGSFQIVEYENEKTFSYTKQSFNKRAYVVLNFTAEDVPFEKQAEGDLVLIHSNANEVDTNILSPYEGRL